MKKTFASAFTLLFLALLVFSCCRTRATCEAADSRCAGSKRKRR